MLRGQSCYQSIVVTYSALNNCSDNIPGQLYSQTGSNSRSLTSDKPNNNSKPNKRNNPIIAPCTPGLKNTWGSLKFLEVEYTRE